MLLCRQPLIPSPPLLLEINGAGVISQQPALSPRTNQCDHEEGKSGIVFKGSKFAVGELVRFALYSLFPPKKSLEEASIASLFRLSYGTNYKLHGSHGSVLINHKKRENVCWLYFISARAPSRKKNGQAGPNLTK